MASICGCHVPPAMKQLQLQGPKHKNWPVYDPRAAAPAGSGANSCETGFLIPNAPKWGVRWPILLTNPALIQCVVRRGAWGTSSIRVAKKNARCPGLWYLSGVRGG
jgi:hypothetical protein